jgi:hypothetical protein
MKKIKKITSFCLLKVITKVKRFEVGTTRPINISVLFKRFIPGAKYIYQTFREIILNESKGIPDYSWPKYFCWVAQLRSAKLSILLTRQSK